jgi:integrase
MNVAFCIAAYTGARRSEILRSRVDDIDFDAGTITIREKKA